MLNSKPTVLERLAAADREHQKEAGGRFLLRSLKYLCAFVLGAFVLDVALHLSAGWRLGLLLSLLGGAVFLAGLAWRMAFVRRNRLEHIARFLETRDPSLGSRLINLLQLQDQTRDPALAPLTRELARQAVEGYAAELADTPLEGLAWTGELRRHLVRAMWALLGFAAVLAVFFRVVAIEVARFGDPYGDHPPYSFTRLEIVDPGPAGTNVLYGKGTVLRVKASGHHPREVFLTTFPTNHPEQALTVPMFDKAGGGFDQLVDNVRRDLVAFAHTKDQVSRSKQVRIGVVLTPQLEHAFVQIAAPAYTGLKPEEKAYAFKGVQALEGSEVRFRLQSNRPLRDGLLQLTVGDQPPQRIALKPTAENEVSGAFVAAESGRLRFSLVDVAGLPSQGDWQGALTVTHDLPPEIRISEPERDAIVAVDFKVQAHIEASDDYGLRTIRIHRGVNGVFEEPKVLTYDQPVRDSHEMVDLNFADMDVKPGDVVSVFAEAIDTAPQPHLAHSQTVKLMVISVEDYNNFLREQTDLADTEAKYEALMDDLQELIDNQKQLGEAAQKLKDQAAKAAEKDRDRLAQQLDSLLAQQNELNQKLTKHAERMENFVRPDPLYDVERDLQEKLREQAANIRQSVSTNGAAAQNIAQRSSPSAGPRQVSPDLAGDFKQESDDQVKRLGGVQDSTERQVAETLKDLSLMQELQKDFNQFEALYQAQQELAEQAKAYNRAGELSREDQLALKELAGVEKQVGDLLEQLGQRLREDAQAAEKLFPKAAQSGNDLADSIKDLRLPPLARQATDQMLAANGERSAGLSEHLRSEMEKLFGQCQGGKCPGGDEVDNYLRLTRSLNPGNNFAQMARSKKFGRPGKGQAMGMGEGAAGTSGYAASGESPMRVMGNEQAPSRGSATTRQSSRYGKGAGLLAGKTANATPDKTEAVKGLNPINRQSGAVATETPLEEYSDLVDTYFKAITTKKP